jgi:hypothetical protein
MKPARAGSGQRAKCVGSNHQPKTAVRHPARIKPSRDGHPLKVQPGHRPAQLRKPRPQPKTESLAPFLQPIPPAADRVAIHAALNCRLMHGTARQKPQQHDLLNRPAVPTPRRDTFRQPRTGLAAALAKEPGDEDRIQRTRRRRTPVHLAPITAVTPKPRQTAMRTGRRPIDRRLSFQKVLMVVKGHNRGHNPLHRPVSFVRVESVDNFPR